MKGVIDSYPAHPLDIEKDFLLLLRGELLRVFADRLFKCGRCLLENSLVLKVHSRVIRPLPRDRPVRKVSSDHAECRRRENDCRKFHPLPLNRLLPWISAGNDVEVEVYREVRRDMERMERYISSVIRKASGFEVVCEFVFTSRHVLRHLMGSIYAFSSPPAYHSC